MKITPVATESQHSTPKILQQDSASIDNLFQQVKEMPASSRLSSMALVEPSPSGWEAVIW